MSGEEVTTVRVVFDIYCSMCQPSYGEAGSKGRFTGHTRMDAWGRYMAHIEDHRGQLTRRRVIDDSETVQKV